MINICLTYSTSASDQRDYKDVHMNSPIVSWSALQLSVCAKEYRTYATLHSQTYRLIWADCFSCQSFQLHKSWPSLVLACIEIGIGPRYLAASMVANGSLIVQFATSRKCCQKWNVQTCSQSKLCCEQASLLVIKCLRSFAGRAVPAGEQNLMWSVKKPRTASWALHSHVP